ncbi:MAG: hypothetical protein AMXMBFR56_53610 [Polyangiaceae bacterium]
MKKLLAFRERGERPPFGTFAWVLGGPLDKDERRAEWPEKGEALSSRAVPPAQAP